MSAELDVLKSRIRDLESTSAAEKKVLASEVDECTASKERVSQAMTKLQGEYEAQSKKMSKFDLDLRALKNSNMETTKGFEAAKEKIVTLQHGIDGCADGTKKCRETMEKNLIDCLKEACRKHQHLRRSVFEAHMRNGDRRVDIWLTGGTTNNKFHIPKPQNAPLQVTISDVVVPCSGAAATITLQRVPPCRHLEVNNKKATHGPATQTPLKITFTCDYNFVFARAGKPFVVSRDLCMNGDLLYKESISPTGTLVWPIGSQEKVGAFVSDQDMSTILGESNSNVRIYLVQRRQHKNQKRVRKLVLYIAAEAGVSDVCVQPGSNPDTTFGSLYFKTKSSYLKAE